MSEESLIFKVKPSMDEVAEDFAALSAALKQRAVRAGLVRGAKPIKDAQAALAPVDEGSLKRGVAHRQVSRKELQANGWSGPQNAETIAGIVVGVNRKVNGRSQYKKAIWGEFGTKNIASPSQFISRGFDDGSANFETLFYQGLTSYLDRTRSKTTK